MSKKVKEGMASMVPINNPTFSEMKAFCQRDGKKRGISDYCTQAIKERLERDLAAEEEEARKVSAVHA